MCHTVGMVTTPCEIDQCERVVVARSMCRKHYSRWQRTGDATTARAKLPNGLYETCTVEGCDKPHRSKGLCDMHRYRLRYHGDPGSAEPIRANARQEGRPCSIDGCERFANDRNRSNQCSMHDARKWRTGSYGSALPLKKEPKGQCILEGCEMQAKSKAGHCKRHYERIRRTGNPGPAGLMVAVKGSGCKLKNGYIQVTTSDGQKIHEHRYVMEQYLGRKLVDGENVHHKNGVKTDNNIGNLELWKVIQPTGQRVTDLIEYVARYHKDAALEMIARL